MCDLMLSACVPTSNPATVALPPLGARIPVRMRIVVDLPAPFGPRKPKIWPLGTSKLKRFTAMKLPNRFSRPFTTTAMSSCVLMSFLSLLREHRDENVLERRVDPVNVYNADARATENRAGLLCRDLRRTGHQVNAIAEQAGRARSELAP